MVLFVMKMRQPLISLFKGVHSLVKVTSQRLATKLKMNTISGNFEGTRPQVKSSNILEKQYFLMVDSTYMMKKGAIFIELKVL